MAGGRSPAPLAALALFSIIRHMWRRSGAEDQLVCYNHAHARHRVGVTSAEHHTMKPYVAIIDRIVTRILELDLPKVLVMQLGNCFIDFERRMVKFSMFLVSALDEATLDNVRAGVRSIVVNQYGHIDKQQTIINMAFGSVNSTLNPRFTAYHCVSFNRVLDLLKEKEAGNVNLEKEIHLRRSFGSPMTYWEPRHLVEGMEGQFLQCVAVHGTNEALEYFLKTIEEDQTQVELSRAAVHMLNYDHDVDKLLFFYKNMDRSAWLEFNKRNFYRIFTAFFNSKRYRHMCVDLYGQVRSRIDFSLVKAVLHFLSVQCYADFSKASRSRESYRELLLSDLEIVFLSIWRIMPMEEKRLVCRQQFDIINRLLYRNKLYVVATIIEDQAFDVKEQVELITSVIMTLIVTGKEALIDKFLKIFRHGSFDIELIRKDFFKVETFKRFVILGDHCCNIEKYDYLLQFKYTTEEERNTFKKELLADTDFVANLIDTIRQGLMIVENFQKFLVWACMNNRILVTYYIQKTLLPENLMNEIFKNYLVSTKRSIYTIDIFNLTDMQMRSIRASIAEDSSTLYQYCSDLLKMKDYAALPRMLTCVFQNDSEREQFVRNYFRSYSGIRAIYGMLIDDSFDDRFFCRYQFKVKIAMFLEFKKYWIISETIARDLEEVLVVYGHPMRAADILKCRRVYNLLPHESMDAFRIVCDANLTIFKCLLRNSEIVELINHVALYR